MKQRKKILIVLVILLVVLAILITAVKSLSNKKEFVDEDKTNQEIHKETIEEYYSDKILPQGVSTLYGKYTGANDKNDLYRSISKMINYLPQLCTDLQNMKEDEVEQYFSENSAKVESCFGIDKLEEFIDLAKYLREYEIGNNEYQYCTIVSGSYGTYNDYLTFNLNIVYENLNNISFKVYFANKSVTKPEVKFIHE